VTADPIPYWDSNYDVVYVYAEPWREVCVPPRWWAGNPIKVHNYGPSTVKVWTK
jgi:hypothetical protein